jgi:hypothetical protein
LLAFFKEKSYLITAAQKILIAYMISALAGGELGHRMVFEGEVLEQIVGFCEEGRDGLRVEGIGDDEVAITFKVC